MSLLDRPDHGTLLRSFAGHVDVAPALAFDRLVERLRGTENFEADPVSRRIVQQGGWWYRAEYRVLADGAGSRVEFEIVNVAQPLHWAGPITGRKELRAAPEVFQMLLSRLDGDRV